MNVESSRIIPINFSAPGLLEPFEMALNAVFVHGYSDIRHKAALIIFARSIYLVSDTDEPTENYWVSEY